MAIGTHTLTRPLIVADTYGAGFYGRISSSMVIVLTLTGTSAPFAAGLMFDAFGSYNPMLILACGFSLFAIVLIWLLPKRATQWSVPTIPAATARNPSGSKLFGSADSVEGSCTHERRR
jgi:hypothetical protein